jgi:hypothetical protein
VKKSECIAKYGEAAWEKILEQRRAYYKAHKEQENAATKKWREEHPEHVIVKNREKGRKGGRRYAKHLKGKTTGIQGDKNIIRAKHAREYKPYKDTIAPESQIHHEWVPDTSEYRGVALVEADAHMHGFVDVIEILDGKITLLTEEEVKKGVKRYE